jgi:hypothetical protein
MMAQLVIPAPLISKCRVLDGVGGLTPMPSSLLLLWKLENHHMLPLHTASLRIMP